MVKSSWKFQVLFSFSHPHPQELVKRTHGHSHFHVVLVGLGYPRVMFPYVIPFLTFLIHSHVINNITLFYMDISQIPTSNSQFSSSALGAKLVWHLHLNDPLHLPSLCLFYILSSTDLPSTQAQRLVTLLLDSQLQ